MDRRGGGFDGDFLSSCEHCGSDWLQTHHLAAPMLLQPPSASLSSFSSSLPSRTSSLLFGLRATSPALPLPLEDGRGGGGGEESELLFYPPSALSPPPLEIDEAALGSVAATGGGLPGVGGVVDGSGSGSLLPLSLSHSLTDRGGFLSIRRPLPSSERHPLPHTAWAQQHSQHAHSTHSSNTPQLPQQQHRQQPLTAHGVQLAAVRVTDALPSSLPSFASFRSTASSLSASSSSSSSFVLFEERLHASPTLTALPVARTLAALPVATAFHLRPSPAHPIGLAGDVDIRWPQFRAAALPAPQTSAPATLMYTTGQPSASRINSVHPPASPSPSAPLPLPSASASSTPLSTDESLSLACVLVDDLCNRLALTAGRFRQRCYSTLSHLLTQCMARTAFHTHRQLWEGSEHARPPLASAQAAHVQALATATLHFIHCMTAREGREAEDSASSAAASTSSSSSSSHHSPPSASAAASASSSGFASFPAPRLALPPLSLERLRCLVLGGDGSPSSSSPSSSPAPPPLSSSVLSVYVELVSSLMSGVDVDSLTGCASATSVLASHPLLVDACRPSFIAYANHFPLLDSATIVLAVDMLNAAVRLNISHRRNHSSLSAASLFLACALQGVRLTQHEFCTKCGLTEVTLRKVNKELGLHWRSLVPAGYKEKHLPPFLAKHAGGGGGAAAGAATSSAGAQRPGEPSRAGQLQPAKAAPSQWPLEQGGQQRRAELAADGVVEVVQLANSRPLPPSSSVLSSTTQERPRADAKDAALLPAPPSQRSSPPHVPHSSVSSSALLASSNGVSSSPCPSPSASSAFLHLTAASPPSSSTSPPSPPTPRVKEELLDDGDDGGGLLLLPTPAQASALAPQLSSHARPPAAAFSPTWLSASSLSLSSSLPRHVLTSTFRFAKVGGQQLPVDNSTRDAAVRASRRRPSSEEDTEEDEEEQAEERLEGVEHAGHMQHLLMPAHRLPPFVPTFHPPSPPPLAPFDFRIASV